MIIQLSKGKNFYLFHKVSPVAVALSIHHFATMLRSSLSLSDILKILGEQKIDAKLSEAYMQILKDVLSGKTLSESMSSHRDVFTDIVISIVEIGEQGGTLEKNLLYLADYLKEAYELQKKIKGALIYPMIVVVVTMMEIIGVAFFVLPRLESVFTSFDDPPPTTLAIINGAAWFRENIVLIVIGIIVLIIGINMFLKTESGKRFKDRLILKIPVFKQLNKSNLISSFSRTLGILLASGIPLSEGMYIAANTTTNSVYKKTVQEVHESIKAGNTLAFSLSKYPDQFPNTYIKMVEVGEATGNLENNLEYLYQFYTEEVKEISSNLTTLLEPMLMIMIGVMIGGLALTVILPIYQLIGNINA
ncbi:type II secretion system F family protein [Candidatus Dojkabacteria bacterium]|uniref:Type II secretion system F family protein n=1 Tax=Candidatus Dojkabacteria bacterium TaxID=2099670 RepID=A0A955L7I8_9BACT|nr:type II secretion system F family protein [Candidatus Dojkabacteria bacterium]